jgi:hypothetical protein
VAGTLTSTSLGNVDLNGGTLAGTGTVGDNLVDDSTLKPGTSAAATGKLTVTDAYTQDAGGALDIQINGATAGTKYDQLKVTQGATLGGTLNIALGSAFTPTVGQTFTILTASSVTDQFTTVNGLAINGSEHFTITYNTGSVVLTVVSGALAASGNNQTITQAIHPVLYHSAINHVSKGHFALAVGGQSLAPAASSLLLGLPASFKPTLSLARVPAASMTAPVSAPVSFATGLMGVRAFRPRDDFGAPAASSGPGDAPMTGAMGLSPVSAAAYNSMGAMNHLRFECGVDLKALMKTSRKQLVRALWASPDSPEALSIGYMTFIGSH